MGTFFYFLLNVYISVVIEKFFKVSFIAGVTFSDFLFSTNINVCFSMT